MQELLKPYEDKMNKTLDVLQSEYGTIRAGRANPHVLDRIKVDYYGTPTPLQQVGNISVPEARMIVIQPWEKNLLKVIEKAILTSDLGINPTNDGTVIRLVFPELMGEYGLKDAYNLDQGWFDTDYIGIDKGISLLMIANYECDFVWDLFMKNEAVQRGMDRLGFKP